MTITLIRPVVPRQVMPRPVVAWPPGQRDDYAARVLRTRPEALIGYWPLDEPVGSTVAHDLSWRRHNGVYVATTLGREGIGDGRTCAQFDGSTSYVNIYSAALASAFNGARGTLITWMRISAAGVWPGTARRGTILRTDANNRVLTGKAVGNLSWAYIANAASSVATLITTRMDWFCETVTWSASDGVARFYLDGNPYSRSANPCAWVGALNAAFCCIGAGQTTPIEVWSGWLAHSALWTEALSPAEIYELGPAGLGR